MSLWFKIKKIFFILISVGMGIVATFLIAELSYRFYLFGSKLHFQDNSFKDKIVFDKHKEKKHIFFVGDSFTRGYPFSVDQSYPMLLEKRLNKNKIEIVNFARVGSDIFGQVNMIEKIVELQPDLIIWGLSTNDVVIPSPSYQVPPRESPPIQTLNEQPMVNYFSGVLNLSYDCLFRVKMGIFSTVKELLNTYSCFYEFLRQFRDIKLLRFLKSKNDADRQLCEITNIMSRYYRKDTKSEQALKPVTEAILHVKKLLDTKKISFILLYVPQESDVNERLFKLNIIQFDSNIDNYDSTIPRKFIRDFCLKSDIKYIDPSGYIGKELNRGKSLFMKYDRHYNYFGNNRLAEFLSQDGVFLFTVKKLYAEEPLKS